MRASVLLGLPLCVALVGLPAIAQASKKSGIVRTHIEGIDIPTIANAPFSARVVVTWDRQLQDGSTQSRQYYTTVARDNQGRVRRETREFVPANSSEEPPLRTFTIFDPVAGTRTTCNQARGKCAVAAFRPRLDMTSVSGGTAPAGENDGSRVSLGQQTMDGFTVVGTRVTDGSDGAQGGASTPAHTDSWYSPDLHIDLETVRSNPQMGQVTLHVRDLVRGEPDPSWFTVPSGYEVKSAPGR